MFTGIIQDVGKIVSLDTKNKDILLGIETNLSLNKTHLGDSISCSGICLTVVAINKNIFKVELSQETLNITSAKNWKIGTKLNLEFSLLVGDQIGGHIVSGHVDGIAEVSSIKDEGDSTRFMFEVPEELARFIAPKGSVALNGTSLTVNEVKDNSFGINLVPHTKKVTSWGKTKVGDPINLEIDTLARYVARLAEYQ